MTLEQLSSPTAVAIVVLLVLAFVRLSVWWALIRLLLTPLMRPTGLLVAAAAVAAFMHFN